jgi:histidinol-phosphate phosphatase family protein
MRSPLYDIVVPTVGRPSLGRLLRDIAREVTEDCGRVIVVDDSQERRGPAATRNRGWRAAHAPWVVFLDDDVELPRGWGRELLRDLTSTPAGVAGVQARITVPMPEGRRPTDWERNVDGLSRARWATADMAYRRDVLESVGGFDERFPRAYREDADLALRMLDAGWQLRRGDRTIVHPVRPAPWWISIPKQAGNVDDALMRRLHGRDWHRRVGASRGGRTRHLVVTGLAATAVAASFGRSRHSRQLALATGALGLGVCAQFAWQRIAPGPRMLPEVAAMTTTSVVIPFAASAAWMSGVMRARRLADDQRPISVVLVDRDGTIVIDVPYNGDPARVEPIAGAREALDRLRAAGLRVGVVTNQSGIARGTLTAEQVDQVNARVDELLGPFDVFLVCPHGPDEGCACRKPSPGLIIEAARRLGVGAPNCAVVGDIGADVVAARRAGALGLLVPNAMTRSAEVDEADIVMPDLGRAVDLLLDRSMAS